MGVLTNLKAFGGNQRGNVAMMTALVAVPLLGLLGGAVDIVRMNQMRSEIQGVVDAGVLAISEINNNNDPKKTVEQFIKAGLRQSKLDPSAIKLDVKVAEVLNGKTVDVTANYEMQTFFLGMFGMNKMDIRIASSGTQTYSDIEIALVLDISGSMNGTKFTNMQDAAEDFIDAVLTDKMKNQTTISIIPFSSNVNVGDDFKSFARTADIDTNHDTNFSDGHIWDGCVEWDVGMFDDNKPAANSLDVMPRFKDDPDASLRHCPESNNEALYLSNNSSDLKDKIDDLTISRNTSLDVGALVGLKALAPDMKGHISGDQQAKHPAAYNSGVMKALIIMTDGEATDHMRPNDGCDVLGYWAWSNYQKKWVWQNCGYQKYSNAQNRTNFTQVCNEAKANGVMVYTIGFQIAKGGNSDIILRDCASNTSQYYYIEDTDISSAFKSIAASINGVRLTL
ncbi:TadE/TadG family type IV pilus assembly protein [Aquisalinus flavus]|nr:TadE/TadG family type IV pilus assembly protein [Aquisalinus flavus]MBD0425657.1 pilus assembly protein [Aquisalinus flavus]